MPSTEDIDPSAGTRDAGIPKATAKSTPKAKPTAGTPTKKCRERKQTKPVTAYYKVAAGQCGVYHLCAECHKARREQSPKKATQKARKATKPAIHGTSGVRPSYARTRGKHMEPPYLVCKRHCACSEDRLS
jgi:hypothetical protein